MIPRHVFEIDDGERWWYVAHTSEEALCFARRDDVGADWFPPYGEPGEWEREISVTQLPDDKDLRIAMIDDLPEQIVEDYADFAAASFDGQIVIASAGAWAEYLSAGTLVGGTVF